MSGARWAFSWDAHNEGPFQGAYGTREKAITAARDSGYAADYNNRVFIARHKAKARWEEWERQMADDEGWSWMVDDETVEEVML